MRLLVNREASKRKENHMFRHFFQARDELDRALRADERLLAAPSLAIFRLFLEHAFYKGGRYGIRQRQGRLGHRGHRQSSPGSPSGSVKTYLPQLEHDVKLIHRQPRPIGTGGRDADEISIVWPTFHGPELDGAEGADPALTDGP